MSIAAISILSFVIKFEFFFRFLLFFFNFGQSAISDVINYKIYDRTDVKDIEKQIGERLVFTNVFNFSIAFCFGF